MADEDEIRELLAVWTQSYADQAWDNWSNLFTSDAVLTLADGRSFYGRDAIRHSRGGIVTGVGPRPQVTYVCAPAVIRVDGKTARAASDYVAYERSSSDAAWQIRAVGRLLHDLAYADRWRVSGMREWAYFSGPEIPTPLPSVVRESS